MNPHDAFFPAILASPDDDAPRLVYADWLEEQGETNRSEFIRVQCALARMPASDPRRPELTAREQDLLAQFGWTWAEPFGEAVSEWVYRRGFIERIQTGLEAPPEVILDILSKAPIRHLRDIAQFCDVGSVLKVLPHFERLTGLEFWYLYAFEDALVAEMLASPHLRNLRTLILHHDRNGNLVDPQVIIDALASPYRANLEELAVNVDSMWRGPSRGILNAMAASPHLRRLRKLVLTNAGDEGNRPEMDLATARLLGNSPNLAGLLELDLGNTSFPLEVWDEVLRWPFLPRLKWLRLHYARQVNPPSYLTVAQLAQLPNYRASFERACARIDWETQFISPWDVGCWRGQSWEGLREQHLFSMWHYVQRGDFDGLEAAFRADCCRYAGEVAAAEVDALPFPRYGESLKAGLQQTLTAMRRIPAATAAYLRIRPDIDWSGDFHLSNEALHEPFTPYRESSYSGPLFQHPAPPLLEAATVRDRHPRNGILDPGGVNHFLLARTVAAFGRVVAEHANRPPVFLSLLYAVFRM